MTRVLLGLTDPSEHARHTCDRPWCVNPAHLVPGTHLDNMADMRERNRAATGERNGNHRLTDAQRVEIHMLVQSGRSLRSVAQQFGVSHVTVGRVVGRW